MGIQRRTSAIRAEDSKNAGENRKKNNADFRLKDECMREFPVQRTRHKKISIKKAGKMYI
jgi:hypothetical protein